MKTFKHDWLAPKIVLPMDYDSEGKRFYTLPSGLPAYSVTTKLQPLSKGYIDRWKARQGEKKAAAITKQAGIRGTTIHKLCEQHLLNQPIDKVSSFDRATFKQIRLLLDHYVDDIRAIEYQLFCEQLLVAGTTDCIANWAAKLSIIDFKTAKRARDDYLSYCLQATAYAHMANNLYNLQIEQCVVVIAIDHDLPKVLRFPADKYHKQMLSIMGQKQ